MKDLINFIKLSIKGFPIGVLAGVSDMGSMFLMGKFTNLNITYQVYISSFLGMIVSFIGNYLWTFSHGKNPSSGKVKFLKFIISHITFTFICSEITIALINSFNKLISTYKDKNNKLINLISDNNKLNNTSNALVKGSVNGIFYFVNIFIMKFIF